MKFSLPLLAAVAEAAVIGGRADIPPPGDDGRYTISSDGIKAQVCDGDVGCEGTLNDIGLLTGLGSSFLMALP